MTTLPDGRPAPVEARLGRDDDGDLIAEAVDGSSLILRVDGAPGDPQSYFQVDAGAGPGDPLSTDQLRALVAAARLILEADERPLPVPTPGPVPGLEPRRQGPAGLDVDYDAAEAARWAAAETAAALLDTDVALVITLTALADGEVIGADGALVWASDEGVRRWETADHDRVDVLVGAGLVRDLAVTRLGAAALETLRDRETAA